MSWPESLRHARRRLWHRWKVIAHAIGTFQARVLLTIFYFAIAPPFALVVQLLTDPLRLRATTRATSYWVTRTVREPTEKAAARQF